MNSGSVMAKAVLIAVSVYGVARPAAGQCPGPFQVTVSDLGGGCGGLSVGLPPYQMCMGIGESLVFFLNCTGNLGQCGNPVAIWGSYIASIDLSLLAPGCVMVPFPDFLGGASGCCGGACVGCFGVFIPYSVSLIGQTGYIQVARLNWGLELSNALAIHIS